MATKTQLLEAATTYSSVTGVSLAQLSKRVLNDGKFFVRLVNSPSADCTLGSYDRLMAYMCETWPRETPMPGPVAAFVGADAAAKGAA